MLKFSYINSNYLRLVPNNGTDRKLKLLNNNIMDIILNKTYQIVNDNKEIIFDTNLLPSSIQEKDYSFDFISEDIKYEIDFIINNGVCSVTIIDTKDYFGTIVRNEEVLKKILIS